MEAREKKELLTQMISEKELSCYKSKLNSMDLRELKKELVEVEKEITPTEE